MDGGDEWITFEPVAPIFYDSSTNVIRETYNATISASGGGTFNLRVELYSLESDAARTVYGDSAATPESR